MIKFIVGSYKNGVVSGIWVHVSATGCVIVVFCCLTVVIGPVYQAPVVKNVEVETVAIRIVRFVYVALHAAFGRNQIPVILFPAGAGPGWINSPAATSHCTFFPVAGSVLKGKTLAPAVGSAFQ